MAVEMQRRGAQAVAVFDDEGDRTATELGARQRRIVVPAIGADIADVERGAAAQGVFEHDVAASTQVDASYITRLEQWIERLRRAGHIPG